MEMDDIYVVVIINNIKGAPAGMITLRTNINESIAVFKTKIQEIAHPPVHVDFVSHNSVMMEAHKKMGDYGIRHGSNIVCHPFFSFYEYAEARGQPIPRRNQRT